MITRGTITSYRNFLAYDKGRLDAMEKDNKRKEELEKKLKEILELRDSYQDYRSLVEYYLKLAEIKSEEYKETKKAEFEDIITRNLAIAIPDEKFIAKIDLDDSLQYPVGNCKLYHEWEDINDPEAGMLPKAQNGGMVQQVMSITGSATANYFLGNNIMKFDEAFSNVATSRLEKVAPILETLESLGIQANLVEHKEQLISCIPNRREMYLLKDREKSITKLVDVIDYVNGEKK